MTVVRAAGNGWHSGAIPQDLLRNASDTEGLCRAPAPLRSAQALAGGSTKLRVANAPQQRRIPDHEHKLHINLASEGMDAADIFQSLGVGIKFDQKRFGRDVALFKRGVCAAR